MRFLWLIANNLYFNFFIFGSANIDKRGGDYNDVINIPDNVWDTEKNYTTTPPHLRQSGNPCNGIPTTDWSCCTSASPCNVGGGDCDNDADCSGTLTCGRDNCRRDFSSGGSSWSSSADCCVGK